MSKTHSWDVEGHRDITLDFVELMRRLHADKRISSYGHSSSQFHGEAYKHTFTMSEPNKHESLYLEAIGAMRLAVKEMRKRQLGNISDLLQFDDFGRCRFCRRAVKGARVHTCKPEAACSTSQP